MFICGVLFIKPVWRWYIHAYPVNSYFVVIVNGNDFVHAMNEAPPTAGDSSHIWLHSIFL